MRRLLALLLVSTCQLVLLATDQTVASKGIVIEEAMFELQVLKEPEHALDIFESLGDLSDLEKENLGQVLYGIVLCLIELDRLDEARSAFGRLAALDNSSKWLESLSDVVPSSFVVRNLPWKSASQLSYRWKINESGLEGVVELQRNPAISGELEVWSIRAMLAGHGLHSYELDLERSSLALLSSNYRARGWNRFEALQILRDASDTRDDYDVMDRILIGQMLSQYDLFLGFSKEDEIYSWERGGVYELDLEVNSLERLPHPRDAFVDCWVVSTQIGQERWRFWLNREGEKELVKAESEAMLIEMVAIDTMIYSQNVQDAWIFGSEIGELTSLPGASLWSKTGDPEKTVWLLPHPLGPLDSAIETALSEVKLDTSFWERTLLFEDTVRVLLGASIGVQGRDLTPLFVFNESNDGLIDEVTEFLLSIRYREEVP
jgi:tetratricopeptide (TPR) repeat protein